MTQIYWSDPKGNHPPEDAQFFLYPFQASQGPIPLGNVERIEQLPQGKKIKISSRTLIPNQQEWRQGVETVLSKQIPKVVLARKEILELEEEIDPLVILAGLKEISENAFLYCICFEDEAFLGATPERLFSRTKNRFSVDALAGTTTRGQSIKQDEALQKALLQSPKDLSEILPVQQFLTERLKQFTKTNLSFSPISVRPAKNIQHLYSQGITSINPQISNHQIIEQIHPTPALAGFPQEEALRWIETIEPFERHLYGGVFGWQTKNASEWIVMIRCCSLKKKQAILYAGTGIVAGSNPDREWEELNQKTALYDTIFVS